MSGHLAKISCGVGVFALAMRPVFIASPGALLSRQRQRFAQLGGGLVQGFHDITVRPAGEEVKR
jgi:hypothetical protein